MAADRSGRTTLKSLIAQKRAWHKKFEHQLFKTNLMFYQQNFQGLSGDDLTLWNKNNYTFNLTHAMVGSGIAEIVGNNPRVYARATQPTNKLFEQDVNTVMDQVFAASAMRTVLSLAITDASLKRRGVLKRKVNPKTRMPTVHKVNPERHFFDLSAQTVDQSAYMLEATLVPFRQFMGRVKSGEYDSKNLSRVSGNGYSVPKWMRDASGSDAEAMADMRWITVWEFYDAWEGTVTFYHEESDSTLHRADVDDHPYAMFSLIPNGQNLVGLSDAEMIQPQQLLVNAMMCNWQDTCEAGVPGILADGEIIDGSSVEKAARATPDRITVVNRTKAGANNRRATLSDALFNKPVPQHPEQNEKLIEAAIGHAQQMTGYTPGHRGQFQNVRTAKEVAYVIALNQNRLSSKSGELNDAVSMIASKCWDCIVKYAPNGINLRSRSGTGPDFVTLGDWLAEAEGMTFEMVPFNPIRNNPAVQAEVLLEHRDYFSSDPNWDRRQIAEAIHKGLGLPDATLRSHAEVIAEAQAKADADAAAAATAPAPSPAPAPAPGGPGLPLELAGLMG